MRTFVYKAYTSKRNRKLHRQIEIAASVWNHCIALHKRYYRRFGKHLNQFRLMKHLTRLKKLPRYQFWNNLGSQAIQDVVQRIEKAYKLFFENLKTRSGRKVRPPSFQKRKKYRSFTLKQAGYAVDAFGSIVIAGQKYRFFESRELLGKIKTLTIKRDSLGDIYFVFVTDAEHQVRSNTATTEIAGGDFGLKTFLTLSDGSQVVAPEPFKKSLKQVRKANKRLSGKAKGSHNREKARRHLARLHRKVANQRRDFHFKAALAIIRQHRHFALEDLNLQGMKAIWGRKVSDMGFADFVKVLEFTASKNGCTITKIDRWYPSSKECHLCGEINHELNLKDRFWICTCGAVHDRDHNAAINIQRVGTATLGLGDVRPAAMSAIAA